jgi:hypothetical protein
MEIGHGFAGTGTNGAWQGLQSLTQQETRQSTLENACVDDCAAIAMPASSKQARLLDQAWLRWSMCDDMPSR